MKRIVILGGGESGAGAAVLAQKEGFDVFVSDLSAIKEPYKKLLDDHHIEWEEGQHTAEKIINADEIIKSPGIPKEAPMVQKLMQQGTPIISEIEFAGRYTHAKMVCITGSNGKTTTTSLIYHIFKTAGLDVGLAGNIGHSLALQVAESPHEYYVIELSSFQLDNMYQFKADVAILLNITPDHLDRYDYKFENYIASKFRIAMNQTENDYLIYDADDPVIEEWLQNHTLKVKLIPFSIEKELPYGAFLKDNKIHIMLENQTAETTEIDVEEISLRGKHNIKNTMAASVAARLVNIRNNSLRDSLKGFKGVDHRLEEVKVVEGVTYVNDSKATNVNSVYFALDTIKTPIVWIVGGQDKGNDYNALLPYIHEKVKAIVCLGVDNTPILRSFGNVAPAMVETHSMEEAVRTAQKFATEGDTVLLSPACASFDLFKSYEDRGDQFKAAVARL